LFIISVFFFIFLFSFLKQFLYLTDTAVKKIYFVGGRAQLSLFTWFQVYPF